MPSTIDMTIRRLGATVRERRKSNGMTQIQLAQIAGVSVRSIRDLECGTAANFRLSTLVRVMDALDLKSIQIESS